MGSHLPAQAHVLAGKPSGTYLILKDIPKCLQQRYALEQEGAIYLRPDAG